jgi:hypothetical protein
MTPVKQSPCAIRDVQVATCCVFRLTMDDLRGPKRKRKFSWPRQIAMALCREVTNASTTEIGHHFGNRDHSTVINSVRVDRRRSVEKASWAVQRGLVLAAIPAATEARLAQAARVRESFSVNQVSAA